jgi:HTH-type transcriptional regulator / antitoxin HipB
MIDSIGGMIRFHRKKAGLTQIALAELAGVGKATVFDVEKDKPTVRLDSLLKVLRVLNLRLTFQGPLMEEYEKSTGSSQR